jgi:hypothetical protein
VADYRKDFESVDDYRARLKRESVFDEPVIVETDLGAVLEDEPLLPFVVDIGVRTSRRDRADIQAYEDRITRLDNRDKW